MEELFKENEKARYNIQGKCCVSSKVFVERKAQKIRRGNLEVTVYVIG